MNYIEEASKGSSLKNIIQSVSDFVLPKNQSKNNINRVRAAGNYLDRSSIAKASKDLIASFPVLCDDTITPATAAMITKAVERNSVTMLQLVLTSAYLSGSNAREVLGQWHKNLDKSMDMDDYLDIAQNIDDYANTMFKHESTVLESAAMKNDIANMFKESLNHRYPLSSFSESSLMDFSVYANKRTGNIEVYTEAQDPDEKQEKALSNIRKRLDRMEDKEFRERELKDRIKQSEEDRRQRAMQADEDRLARQGQFNKSYELDKARSNRDEIKDKRDYFKSMLLDNDAKKVNELVPSLLIIRYQAIDPNETDDSRFRMHDMEAIIGVKARLIPCDAGEIVDRIRSIEKTKVSLLNLIRATTGEISFARDFVGAVDQAKIEAKQNTRLSKTSPIWRTLQNRSNKSVANRLRKNVANDASAITSLVVSSEIVNLLKKEYNIDISNIAKAKYIMEQYNLIALILVDEQVEVVRFLYDGEKYFQDYSFNNLERETGDGSYKKVINLISKMNR